LNFDGNRAWSCCTEFQENASGNAPQAGSPDLSVMCREIIRVRPMPRAFGDFRAMRRSAALALSVSENGLDQQQNVGRRHPRRPLICSAQKGRGADRRKLTARKTGLDTSRRDRGGLRLGRADRRPATKNGRPSSGGGGPARGRACASFRGIRIELIGKICEKIVNRGLGGDRRTCISVGRRGK